jgi:hypothetical protein
LKLLRTIRLDPSDTFVFERPAEPEEWAVSGAFEYWDRDLEALAGKERAAFRSGFLGIASMGRSTLVQIVEADDNDRAEIVDALSRQLVAHFGAPDVETARAAAEEEVAFAQSLCEYPSGVLIAVHRTAEEGTIREAFRSLQAAENGPKRFRAFSFHAVEGEEGPEERVDLAGMIEGARK